jgi:hypothetical protein
MLKKFSLLMIFAVFGLGLMALAGCGDDEKSSSNSPASTATAEATDSATPEATATESTGTPSDDTEVPQAAIDQAVDACKSSIDAQPTLSGSVKDELLAFCDDIADAKTIADVKKASKNICTKIVQESIPDGTPANVKDQALAACDSVGG